jgi:hypothetical protein
VRRLIELMKRVDVCWLSDPWPASRAIFMEP